MPLTKGGSSYLYIPTEAEQKLDEALLCNNHQSVPKELNFTNIFCGRDEEILKLEGIFRRTAASRGSVNHPPLVLVGGVSGAGKSTLVSKLKEHLSTIEEEFFWINGKFEEVQQQQPLDDSSMDSEKEQATNTLRPFAAFVDAFSHFCDELEEEEPETLEEVRDDILEAVGEQGVLLTEMIPSLTKIIGTQEEAGGETQQGQLQRFHFLFKKFIQALASNVRSVVLVLDDLNRADAASLELLLYLLKSQLKHIMFVGTYRSNEVNNQHKFTKWVNDIQEVQSEQSTKEKTTSKGKNNNQIPSAVIRIELLGMDLETINTILSEVMCAEPAKTRPLAYIVHQKTGGNTFYVIQYLLFLNKRNLMWFDDRKKVWDWEEPAIQKEAAINTTLLDFVKDKLLCSDVAPKILPVAACIGTKFSRETLSTILSGLADVNGLREILPAPDSNILDLLKICEKEGFIERSGNDTYIFVHDKMQEASLSIHPAVTMQQIRYETGTLLYRRFDEKELDEKLFAVVNLLNVGHRRNHSVTPFELAQLNLRAAAKAKRMAAFLSASTYVANALVFFRRHAGDGETHRAFFLELCSLGAEVEVVLGHLGKTEKYCDLVSDSKYDYNVFEQLRIENVLMDKISSIGKTSLALQRCISILEELDCPLPKTTIGQGFRAKTSLFKSRSPKNFPKVEDVQDMKLMTDTAKLEAMRLLDRAATYSHIEANRVLFTICTTRMARWTIRYGLCDRSPPAFALLAIILMHRMGDFKAGKMCGELAVAIMEKLQAISSEIQDQTLMKSRSRATCLANAFVICWVQPLHEYRDELVSGYHSGIQVGDIESAYWNYFLNIAIMFAAGRPLKELEEVCRSGVSEMNAMHRRQAEIFTRVHWQGILNLMGYSPVEDATQLTGSAMNEADYFSKKDEWGSKILSNYFENMKTIMFAFFGDYEAGANLAVERGDRFLKESPGSPWSLGDPFYRGVCLYAATSKISKRHYIRHAERVRVTLQSWVKKGYPNAVHQLQLLDAEHAACTGNRDAAKDLYESACSSATEGGFTHAAAMSHVRYGEFLLSSSTVADLEEGMSQLTKAVSCLEKWGAQGVLESLRERHPDIMAEKVFQ